MAPWLACLALALAPALQSPVFPGGYKAPPGGDLGGGGGSGSVVHPGGSGGHGGGKFTGPGDAGGASGGPSAAPGAGAGQSGSAPGARTAGPAAGAGSTRPPSAVVATGGADLEALTGGELIEDWWIWWEINKSLYLVSSDAAVRRQAVLPWKLGTEEQSQAASRSLVARALLPTLREALDDDAAEVRAAAAVACGRLAGDECVDVLLPLLHDPVQSVRESALLALGATGSARAASLLLGVAHDGHLPGTSTDIVPSAQPLSLVCLAIGRRHGLDEGLDPLVTALLEQAAPDVREAGLLYDALAGARACGSLVRELASERDLDIRLRCRVTEGLPRYDAALLPAAAAELLAPAPDRRRAAAATLAVADSENALPRLQPAFLAEKEPLTRGFLLLSIGAQGGDEARELLATQLRRGRAADRPWIALALGLLARGADDAEARQLLRDGLRDESSAQSVGAWILGCGLARDLAAGPALRAALPGASSPRDRMFAALSLSMLRDGDSLQALRAQLDHERDPLARAGVALAIGLFERPEDAPRLAQELRVANNPMLQSQLASALGLHDTPQAIDALQQLVADPAASLPTEARAAALEALGLLLDRNAGWRLVHAATGRNFAVFPDWLARALATTTL
ncbi:MAG TPA: HEAT repeat domain-containing protein [Planctomycetota bacterium]|nr:HEAT repeat domain-containing protein [Planctomycetota bacterium]